MPARPARPRKARKKPTLPVLGIELGTREVDDPYEPGAKLTATVNLKESPLDHWRASGHIDLTQYGAGERFRSLWEAVSLGGARAFDFTKPFVDKGRIAEPLSNRSHRAAEELAALKPVLGRHTYGIVCAMIGERKFPADLYEGDAERKYAARRARDGLSEMAQHWGMVARGRGR